jgi:hypothetical protein
MGCYKFWPDVNTTQRTRMKLAEGGGGGGEAKNVRNNFLWGEKVFWLWQSGELMPRLGIYALSPPPHSPVGSSPPHTQTLPSSQVFYSMLFYSMRQRGVVKTVLCKGLTRIFSRDKELRLSLKKFVNFTQKTLFKTSWRNVYEGVIYMYINSYILCTEKWQGVASSYGGR